MKEKMKAFFKQIKWWEYTFMSVFIVAIVVSGIVFKSSELTIFCSLFGIVGVFFIAKGMLIGQMISIVYGALYATMSYFNHLYGEMIVTLAVTIPLYIATIISWMRNSSKKDKVVKVNKSLSVLEWCLFFVVSVGVGVGMYFMLRAFKTANLLISTFSVVALCMAGYLVVRRCEYNFIFYILSNIIGICLWMFTIIKESNITYIPTIILFCVLLFLNIFGMITWIKIKHIQNLRKKVVKKRAQKRLVMDTDYMKEQGK